jgi:hypothetical protein
MRKIGIGIFIVVFSVSSQLMGQNGNHLNNMVVSSIKSYIEFDKDWQGKDIMFVLTGYLLIFILTVCKTYFFQFE